MTDMIPTTPRAAIGVDDGIPFAPDAFGRTARIVEMICPFTIAHRDGDFTARAPRAHHKRAAVNGFVRRRPLKALRAIRP